MTVATRLTITVKGSAYKRPLPDFALIHGLSVGVVPGEPNAVLLKHAPTRGVVRQRAGTDGSSSRPTEQPISHRSYGLRPYALSSDLARQRVTDLNCPVYISAAMGTAVPNHPAVHSDHPAWWPVQIDGVL